MLSLILESCTQYIIGDNNNLNIKINEYIYPLVISIDFKILDTLTYNN